MKELSDQSGTTSIGGCVITAMIDEAIANDAYDEAVCSDAGQMYTRCIGENHIETCPVLIAWQDRKAASEKRRGMR